MAQQNVNEIQPTGSKSIVEATANIRELQPRTRNKILEAKVYRAWIHRDPPDTSEKGYRAILLDRQGDAIQANMEASEVRRFTKTLIPGKAYRISGFTCTPTDNWQQTLENTTSLSFTRFTKLDEIPAEGFPSHYFNFVAYNRLPYRVVDPEDKSRKGYPILTDYIGCYISSTDVETIGDPNRDQMVNRKIEIQNLNGNSVELTLWDNLAETFQKEEIDRLEKPILIAVSSCRVSRYRNKLQLSSTPATYYYINPNIPELSQYRAEYREAFNINPPLEIVRHPYEDKEKEKMRNRFPLALLLQQNPKTYETIRFTCDGAITGINITRPWYYPSCTSCPMKVENIGGVFECRVHGPIDCPTYRYKFNAYLTDNTATAGITFFTPKADDILGVDCVSLVKSLNYPDPRDFPEKIHSIVGENHIFQFYYNTSYRQGGVEFVFANLLDKKSVPTLMSDRPSGSGCQEETDKIIEPNIPHQQQMSTPIKCIMAAATTDDMHQQPRLVTQEQDPQQVTPPTMAYADIQTTSTTDMMPLSNKEKQPVTETTELHTPVPPEHDVTDMLPKSSQPSVDKTTTTKRALFQEKTPDPKKNKKD